jgi:hypothetical protein
MIKDVVMHRVICDAPECGESPQDYGDFYAWADDGQAEDEATEAEWLITEDGKHYCPAHIVYDEEKGEFVLKPLAAESGQEAGR